MDLSIIIPTFNECENILQLIKVIKNEVPEFLLAEIIIVDDNSLDGTSSLVENYIMAEPAFDNHCLGDYPDSRDSSINCKRSVVKLIRRRNKSGVISAVLEGIKSSTGRFIMVMDADFSHPPETMPRLINELLNESDCVVVASRYISGGSIVGWPYKRVMISSVAAKIAQHGLGLSYVKDPISGFYAFPRHIIDNIRIESSGYKLLLEILVKAEGIKVKEIPYTFQDRKYGKSKLDFGVKIDYLKSVWYLYRYGRKSKAITQDKEEKRPSILFLSKAARFYTVGASGLLLNYVVSAMFSKGFVSNFWYIYASTLGIILSITSNFFLNKIWTFEDRNFSAADTLKKYGLFSALSAVGAVIQLMLLYFLVQSGFEYTLSLITAVAVASVSNFILNKKWTFHEKIWG